MRVHGLQAWRATITGTPRSLRLRGRSHTMAAGLRPPWRSTVISLRAGMW